MRFGIGIPPISTMIAWSVVAAATSAIALIAACGPGPWEGTAPQTGVGSEPAGPLTRTVTATPIDATITATLELSGTPTSVASGTPRPSATSTETPGRQPTSTATPSPTASPPVAPTDTPHPTPTTEDGSGLAPGAVFLPFGTRRAATSWQPQTIWGSQFSMEWDPQRHRQNVATELPRARRAGLRSIRTHLYWNAIEPDDRAPDAYDWSETDRRLLDYSAAGFDVVVSIVDYPSWAMVYRCGYGYRSPQMAEEWREFVQATVRRYGSAPYDVVAWEIGNEVDAKTTIDAKDRERPPEWGGGQPTVPTAGCWGDRPEEYLAFYRAAVEEIRAHDPDALVTFGNLAFTDIQGKFHRDFLDRFLGLGAGPLVDYVGYHWFPDLREIGFPDEPTGLEKHREIRQTMDRHGLERPIWLTEVYRLTTEGDRGSELAHVRLLTRDIPELLAGADIDRVYWYGWVDFPAQADGYRQRGIVRPDYTPKVGFPLLPLTVRYTAARGWDAGDERTAAWRFQPRGQPWTATFAWSRDGAPTEIEIPAWGPRARVVRLDEAAIRDGDCCPTESVMASRGRYRVRVDGLGVFVGPWEE